MNDLALHLKQTSLGWVPVVTSDRGLRWASLAPDREQALFLANCQFPELSLHGARKTSQAAASREDWVHVLAGAVEQPGNVWQAPLDLQGTAFQQAVWKALQGIPAGSVWTYGQLAKHLGRPRAARAVGSACGANPIPFLVPCHRVVASNGALGGFGLGLSVKRVLLAREGVRY
jgi:AraC family transcriptional regulator of adaptative response/methylated-DNA-[protein]-cysteine methyltransferase